MWTFYPRYCPEGPSCHHFEPVCPLVHTPFFLKGREEDWTWPSVLGIRPWTRSRLPATRGRRDVSSLNPPSPTPDVLLHDVKRVNAPAQP